VQPNKNGWLSISYPASTTNIELLLKTNFSDTAVIIEQATLPEETQFFEAFELQDGKVVINFDRAKNITKDRLRVERKSLLEKLDIEFMQALEKNNDTTSIILEKNRLRNITKIVDEAKSITELQNLTVHSFDLTYPNLPTPSTADPRG